LHLRALLQTSLLLVVVVQGLTMVVVVQVVIAHPQEHRVAGLSQNRH
jgi:hypothetical protein